MANFDYYNVCFIKAESSNQLVIRGEVKNNSGRDYNAVAIRILLFNKNILLLNTIIVVNGLPNGFTKDFYKQIEELEYHRVANLITRYEIYTESAY